MRADIKIPNAARSAVYLAGTIVAVLIARAAYLAWHEDSLAAAAVAVGLAALTGIVTFLLGSEVRRTRELTNELQENEQRLNSIIGSAMDAIITVDEGQNIILFNAAAERIFDCPAAKAIGSNLERFIPERYRAGHREHVKRFGEAGVTERRMGAEMVLAGLRANGQEFPIDASISHSTVAGHKFYTVILRDVTERERAVRDQQRAQQQLQESEQRLQSIIGSAMDAIITIDEDQNVVLFNAAAERIFRCTSAQAIGVPIDRFIPERYRPSHRDHVKRFGEAGKTMRRMGGELVLAGLRRDGEEFPIDASISHMSVGGRKFYTVILRDITERQRAADELHRSHRELRELYEGMHEVREAERTRIARELHDELAQWLTALKMDASWIVARMPREHEQLLAKAERMKGVVDNTVAAMRRIAADLRPVMLDDLGLMPAIENLLYDLSERTGIVVRLRGNAEGSSFREPLTTAVYRMVQEALTNVARHAAATSVEVDLEVRDDALRVRVKDNGRGFKPDPDRKSFGVLGIRERAATLGGSARIHAPPEGGTLVEIEVPLKMYAPTGVAS